MKDKILARLSDADDFVSGQELCNEFGVSRTAVWKAVNRLKKEGYDIESVTNRGYRLKPGNDILSESEIQRFMTTKVIGSKVVVFDECDSTNVRAAKAAFDGEKEGTVIVADHQNSGRGRRGRSWQSPPGTSLSMSVVLRPSMVPGPAPQITLVAAMAVAYAIDDLIDETEKKKKTEKTQIKWPNDIVMGDRKISGILSEISCEIDHVNHIIVGIGVNVLGTAFPADIADKAGSIFSVTGVKVNRNKLVVAICRRFEEFYDVFCQYGPTKELVERYRSKLINIGRGVRVLDPKGEYEGVAKDIAEDGCLIVETPDGERRVSAGEVSVRGLYGYV